MLQISAHVTNAGPDHSATVATNGRTQAVVIPARPDGPGSSLTGGELLCLALATCYCNDLYREARRRGISLHLVAVEVSSTFHARGEPASGITYRARIEGDASDAELRALLEETDAVAEVQNTLRQGCPVRFAGRL